MTLKEYMRQSNPSLNRLAESAEEQRANDEEIQYEERIGGNNHDKI